MKAILLTLVAVAFAAPTQENKLDKRQVVVVPNGAAGGFGALGDFDRDGLPNFLDKDNDGDGVNDKFDRRPYGPGY